MKPSTNKPEKRLSKEFSIEFFDNIPSTVSLIDKFKQEERLINEKLRIQATTKSENKKLVSLRLGSTDHIQSHRNLFQKETIKTPERLERKAYGSSHHFHRISHDSEFNSNQSYQIVQQDSKERRTSHNFNLQSRQLAKSPHPMIVQENKRTATHQAGARANYQMQNVYGQKLNQDSKFESSTISHKTYGIKDSSNNTWTHLPNHFFESKTEGSSIAEMHSVGQIINKRQRSKADLTVAQINKYASSLENNPLSNFNEAISALTYLQRGFQRLPQVETLLKGLANAFIREEKRLQLQVEVITNQSKIKIQEFERMVQDAQQETEQAKLKLIDEENFRIELMKPEKQEQIRQLFSDWTQMASLGDTTAPDFIHEKFFSGVTDPLEVLYNQNLLEEKSQANAFLIDKDVDLGEIIEKQKTSLRHIENEQNKLLKAVQQQTAITVLKRFFRHIVPVEKAVQTDADAIKAMQEQFEERLRLQDNQYNLAQVKYQDLKNEHELLQNQLGNTIREKREKMVVIAKLERELIDMCEKANRLQQEVDNQEARQQFRISKIEEQAKEITQLSNEVANVRAFCVEVENQVKTKVMQIQHYQRESSEQSEQIEKLEEENTALQNNLEETKLKLQRAISDLRVQAQNQAIVQKQNSNPRQNTVHNGKDYGHLLERNILNDQEFSNFLSSLQVDDRIVFEAEILEAAQRSIEQWFQSESRSADPSKINSFQSLKSKISTSYQDTKKLLQGRRGGVILDRVVEFKPNTLKDEVSSNQSSVSPRSLERTKSYERVAQPKIGIQIAPAIKQQSQSDEISKRVEVNQKIESRTSIQPKQVSQPWQPKIEAKPTVTHKQSQQSTQDNISIQTLPEQRNVSVDASTPDVKMEPRPFNLQKKKRNLIQAGLARHETNSQKVQNKLWSQPSKIVAREQHTVVVQGKCKDCMRQMSENEKNESANAYETLLKLQAILGEKARNSSVPSQIARNVEQRLHSIEAERLKRDSIDQKNKQEPMIPQDKKISSKSVSPPHQAQQQQDSHTTSIISRMGPTFSYRPKNVETPNPLLEFDMLIHESGLRTPFQFKNRTDQTTQTDVTVYDRENLLALQQYLGKRIVYQKADVYSTLQAKMRHPDVPFVTKFVPVLGPRSYQSAASLN